ncbi:hypothetical protein SAMN05216599_11057 [Pseudomonas cichorii]|nr:hypothetical protein SAMN05216599_11057 [Pseudomonas cichorii]
MRIRTQSAFNLKGFYCARGFWSSFCQDRNNAAREMCKDRSSQHLRTIILEMSKSPAT